MSEKFWKLVVMPLIGVILVVVMFGLTTYVWAKGFDGRVPPGQMVGAYDLSGMSSQEATDLLQDVVDEMLADGLQVVVEGELKTVPLATLVTTDVIEYVEFPVSSFVDDLVHVHQLDPIRNAIAMLIDTVTAPSVHAMPVVINEDVLTQAVQEQFLELETFSTPASFVPSLTSEGWSIDVREGTSGHEFDWEAFFDEVEGHLGSLTQTTYELDLIVIEPELTVAEAEVLAPAALEALQAAPYTIEYEGDVWYLGADTLSDLLIPRMDGINLDEEGLLNWMSTIQSDVDVLPQDARLNIVDNRVDEFVPAQDGQELDVELLAFEILLRVRQASDEPVELVVHVQSPSVQTGEVNDLGITEILGTGVSSYRGSPYNRRLNIQNGVDLLNGRLIAPGETFSLIESLSPFTYDNGYFPELVIKGDKIEPELGGGLCQIGTTTFRATMNSGLEITERRNHSLVVSYYNDPSNGLPGTDATIYEPAPDYKFTNNTENYVLFQAENLTSTQELRFTFWGTSDGRVGSYTAPVVSRWIPVGEDRMIESEDLAPGEEECQEAHIGADAAFTYTVAHPDGELEETVFESHYRPLPRICLVGVDPEAEEDELEEGEGDPSEELETESTEEE